jgi:hypothetical protein
MKNISDINEISILLPYVTENKVPPVFCITQPSFVSLVDYFLRRN